MPVPRVDHGLTSTYSFFRALFSRLIHWFPFQYLNDNLIVSCSLLSQRHSQMHGPFTEALDFWHGCGIDWCLVLKA